MSTIAAINKAAATYAGAKANAEANRAANGDTWADELIAYWRSEGECTVAAYMENETIDDPAARARIEAHLLNLFAN